MSGGAIEQSISCSRCGRNIVNRDGKTSAGKQRYKCKFCGKVIIPNPGGRIHPVAKELADRLIRQGVTVPVLAKAFNGYASKRWLYQRRAAIK